jgi:1-acyl-sn-glycerol-3-phosphate acyltransferase
LLLLNGLFSDRIGPDRISDMTTNIVLPDLAAYTARICREANVPIEPFKLNGHEVALPVNPLQAGRRTPVILVPADVLRDLPVASSVDDIWRVAAKNEQIRGRMSAEIGAEGRSKQDRATCLAT